MPMRKPFTHCPLCFSDTEKNQGKQHRHSRMNEANEPSPGDHVIRNILNYAKSLSVCQTSELGPIALVMN